MLLQLQNFLFHAFAGDEFENEDWFILPDTVGAVRSLAFYRGVPPRVDVDDIVGRGQVEPHAARFQTDEEKRHLGVVLETIDLFLTVTGAAIQISVGNAPLIEGFAHQTEHLHELGKHQRLVSFTVQRFQRIQQHVHFTRLAAETRVNEFGMVAGLPQAQQAFQNLHSAFVKPFFFNQADEQLAVVIAQFEVKTALGGFHRAVNHPLGARRQFGGNLLFGTAQDERIHHPAQGLGRLLIFVLFNGPDKLLFEIIQPAQQAGHDKGKLRPEFKSVVFHRCAGHSQTMLALQAAGSPRGLGQGVLDGLGFVQHDVVETIAAQFVIIHTHHAVSGEHEVVIGKSFHRRAGRPKIGQHLQAGGEFGNFALPVDQQRTRHHNQVRRLAVAAFPQRKQEGQHLHGLAQPHIIGQNAAKAVFVQKVQPVVTRHLIGAQRAAQTFGQGVLGNTFKVFELLQALPEFSVYLGLLCLFGQFFEHQGVEVSKAERVGGFIRFGSKAKKAFVALQPCFRQAANGTIGQFDIAALFAQSAFDFGQRDGLLTELHHGLHIEPVDARGDVDRKGGLVAADTHLFDVFFTVNFKTRGSQSRHLIEQKIHR